MKFFRNALFSRIFALLAGITFLNMSFILAEFDALGMAKNVKIVQIIINSGIEEEKHRGRSYSGAAVVSPFRLPSTTSGFPPCHPEFDNFVKSENPHCSQ